MLGDWVHELLPLETRYGMGMRLGVRVESANTYRSVHVEPTDMIGQILRYFKFANASMLFKRVSAAAAKGPFSGKLPAGHTSTCPLS